MEAEWPDSVERERMANYRTPSQVVLVVIFVDVVVVVFCVVVLLFFKGWQTTLLE